jgi:hypothetical protein
LVITPPLGVEWFVSRRQVKPMPFPFMGHGIFVAARFSSGISMFSSRHVFWPEFAKVVDFPIVQLEPDRPMWVYLRHRRTTSPWDVGEGCIDESENVELRSAFGIDWDKVERLRTALFAEQHAGPMHGGLNPNEHLDLLFRIAAVNRQIDALLRRRKETSSLEDTSQGAVQDLLRKKQGEREALIEAFREVGRTIFA